LKSEQLIRFLVLATLVCFITPTSGQEVHSWHEAKSQSAKTGKPILLDFYFQGCLPCQDLHAEVFKNRLLRSRIDSHYHLFLYDIDTENLHLEDHFSVEGYPTTIIVDSEGVITNKFSGYSGPFHYMKQIIGFTVSEVDSYDYKIPSKYWDYKSDINVSRNLVRHLLSDPSYEISEYYDPLGIYEDYFYREKEIDTIYVKIAAEKLAHLKEPREWFMKNAQLLKEEYGIEFMENLYYNVLEYEIPSPRVVNSYRALYKRVSKIADKLSEYAGKNKAYRDSIYYRKAFLLDRHLNFGTEELSETNKKNILGLLEYENADAKLIEELYEQVLDLSLNIPCTHELVHLIKLIDSNPLYSNLPSFVEIQAISYFRMRQEDVTLSKIVAANEIARKQNLYFKPIFSSLKKGKLLSYAGHKCR